MNQEDKELLLKDLSARLSYGVKVETGGIGKTVESITIKPDYIEIVIKGTYAFSHFIYKNTEEWDKDNDLSRCKPYLRPMESMTEEEHTDFFNYHYNIGLEEIKKSGNYLKAAYLSDSAKFDWLNKHHFDYRYLIEKGLAIAVTKENNPYED